MTDALRRPRVTILSLWRNDAARDLLSRVSHLLAKTSDVADLDWLWVVGDSTDTTLQRLLQTSWTVYTKLRLVVRIARLDTDIVGEDLLTRRKRLALTGTRAFACIPAASDYVLLHESDLRSPEEVVDLLFRAKRLPVAGWPTLDLDEGRVFYDTWAYRHLDGTHFRPDEPVPTPLQPIEVASFGSVWIAPATLVRGRWLSPDCVVDLCRQWRAEDRRLWVDPTIPIQQPRALWADSVPSAEGASDVRS